MRLADALHLPHPVLRALLLFAGFIVAGTGLFAIDLYALYSPVLIAGLLLLVTFCKLVYFVRSVLGWIRKTVDSPEHFYHLTTFMALTILLIVSSYAIDYYCLYRIYPQAFRLPFGERDAAGQILTFFYFSSGIFSTAGSGEVYPTSLLGQFYVTTEMLIGYATTVLIIANLSHLRHLFRATR